MFFLLIHCWGFTVVRGLQGWLCEWWLQSVCGRNPAIIYHEVMLRVLNIDKLARMLMGWSLDSTSSARKMFPFSWSQTALTEVVLKQKVTQTGHFYMSERAVQACFSSQVAFQEFSLTPCCTAGCPEPVTCTEFLPDTFLLLPVVRWFFILSLCIFSLWIRPV